VAVGVAGWMCRGRVGCWRRWVVARVLESTKNPVNVGLQGLTSSLWGRGLPKGVFSEFVGREAAPADLAQMRYHHEIEAKKQPSGVPDPPRVVASVYLCRLDRDRAADAARGRLVVVVERSSLQAKHVNTCSYYICAVIMVDLIAIIHSYMDRGRLCEPNGIKIIVLRALQVEIINGHVFTHRPGLVYYILHIE
jgi:hypothetical protein